MLNLLRSDIEKSMQRETSNDLLIESVDYEFIRTQFVDDDDVDENDPEIQKLLSIIPDGDDDDDEEDVNTEELLDIVESALVGGIL